MNKNKGKTLWSVLALTVVIAGWSLASCAMEDGETGDESLYSLAEAAVDYNTNPPHGRAIFIDFSGDTVVRELPHDFFDLAMFSIGSTVHIIANSGSYGTGVTVLKTDSTDIGGDFSESADSIIQYTFKAGKDLIGYQPEANPLDGASASGATKNVFLVKVEYGSEDPQYFKVVFDSYGPQGRYKITVVPGLAGGSDGKVELSGSLSGITGENGYGYIFFDLHGEGGPRSLNDGAALKDGITRDIPRAAEWDLLCTRTDDRVEITRKTNRSSILLNQVKGLAAAALPGKYLYDVLTASGLDLSTEIDAIGYSWYWTDNRGNYATDKPVTTFVVKTAEGHYAKFRPLTFKGPNSENFHMSFRYYYTGNDTGVFDK